MLRVLRRLTRPTSSPTGGNVASISSFNVQSLCRAAASRLVEIGYQTHDMSSTSTLQLCTLNNYHDVGTRSSNLLPLNSDCFDVPTSTICHRAFSSTDGDLNQQIIMLAESGDTTKAEEILNQMQTDATSPNELPDIDSYTSLMNAYIEEQQSLISTIESEVNEIKSDVNATMPNIQCAKTTEEGTVTITCLAEKVHDLLIQMEDYSGVSDHYSSMKLSGSISTDLRNPSLQPTSHHYDTVILAFANTSTASHETHYISDLTKNAPFIANRWLSRLEVLSGVTRLESLSAVTPTVDSYYHVMEAFAASETSTPTPNKQSRVPTLVQSVFDKLKHNSNNIKPTVREYRLMLRTWCDSSLGNKDAAYNAMGLWMSMQRSFRNGVEEMEPTLEDGKMVLDAWTRSKNKRAARRAQNILSTMENAHSAKKTAVQPNLDCYRSVLITMARSREPTIGSNIPKLFKSMEDNHVGPDTVCFDSAIETLKNCARLSTRDEDRIKYAKATEGMLQRMEQERDRSNTSVIKPSRVTYTNVIKALAIRKSKKAAEKSDELLTKMITEYEAGDESMRPTRDSYVGTINAYGNSGSSTNYIQSSEVLQRMITDYSQGNELARPDISSYHSVIWACSNTSVSSTLEIKREALLMAISTVQNMKKCSDGNHPNPRTYLLLLQCCKSLLPSGPEREKALRSIFRSCCKDGLVNKKVLTEFQSSVSTDAYHKEVVLKSSSYNGIESLPETWTHNLGYRVRTSHGTTENGISRKRSPIISISGEVIASTAYNDYRMRRRWSKKNQKLLQGGRM